MRDGLPLSNSGTNRMYLPRPFVAYQRFRVQDLRVYEAYKLKGYSPP